MSFLILLTTLSLQAAMTCSSVYKFDRTFTRAQTWNQKFRQNMLGNSQAGEQELYFYWHTPNPFNLRKVDETHRVIEPSGKRNRTYHNASDLERESPLEAVNTFMGRQDTSNADMVRAFLNNYKGRVPQPIVETIQSLEGLIASVANPRQSFGYVATAPAQMGGEMLGTFRVYNGVPSHSDTPAYLPMEYSFMHDKVSTLTAKKLQELRKKDPNALIFEIGKFSLNASPEQSDRARNMLELFLLRNYIDALPDEALFYVHTATRAHVRLYQSRYGFRVFEEVTVPGQADKEFVLEATAKELREAFQKIHPLPSLEYSVRRP